MMRMSLIFLYLVSTLSCAKHNEGYINQAVKNEKVFYCFNDSSSTKKIVFDKYRNRIYHYPFDHYNQVKVLKDERIDDEYPVYKTTYIEVLGKKRIATFTMTTQGNEFWEATYKENKSKKEFSLDTSIYDLTKLNAICFDDINNSN
ncbi:hypothetical protein [Acinetobacter sp. MB5]|uniref:hypothetical protein n=1 Tax=Acinetobacter sp. MB5 TaxID=2069438 RepID=UPI000DD05A3D|nr:hypothetical protein [Acinetobacter sp. MB5]